MNQYEFEDIQLGMGESFEVTLTEESLILFSEMSGDKNPLHLNEEYATSKGFNGKVFFGIGILSYLSTLVGMYLPGKYALIINLESNFRKPGFIGDKLEVSGKVKNINKLLKTFNIEFKIINQNNELITDGNVRIKSLK